MPNIYQKFNIQAMLNESAAMRKRAIEAGVVAYPAGIVDGEEADFKKRTLAGSSNIFDPNLHGELITPGEQNFQVGDIGRYRNRPFRVKGVDIDDPELYTWIKYIDNSSDEYETVPMNALDKACWDCEKIESRSFKYFSQPWLRSTLTFRCPLHAKNGEDVITLAACRAMSQSA